MCEAVQDSKSKWYARAKSQYRGSWGITGFRDWVFVGESDITAYKFVKSFKTVSASARKSDEHLPSIWEYSTKKGYTNSKKWTQRTEYSEGNGINSWGWDYDRNVKCKKNQQGHPSSTGHANGCDQCDDRVFTTTTVIEKEPTTTVVTVPPTTTTPKPTTTFQIQTPNCRYVCIFDEPSRCDSTQKGPDGTICPPGGSLPFTFIPGNGAPKGNTCERTVSGQNGGTEQMCPYYCDMRSDFTAVGSINPNYIHGIASHGNLGCVYNNDVDPSKNSVESKVSQRMQFETKTAANVTTNSWNKWLIGLAWVNSIVFVYAIPYYRSKSVGQQSYTYISSE